MLCSSFYIYERPLTDIDMSVRFKDEIIAFAVFKVVAFTTRSNLIVLFFYKRQTYVSSVVHLTTE